MPSSAAESLCRRRAPMSTCWSSSRASRPSASRPPQGLWDKLLELGADRKTVIVAVGGGVVGDLAGFVAATFARGLPLVQVPTTLLAQVDSSVGGKVGINLPGAKNMVGAFWQPPGVLIDTAVLATLADREYRAGLAEVVKYGVILDAEFFAYLEAHAEPTWSPRSADVLEHVIARCCRLKADVVEKDEREKPACGPCSTMATRSATPWRPSPATATLSARRGGGDRHAVRLATGRAAGPGRSQHSPSGNTTCWRRLGLPVDFPESTTTQFWPPWRTTRKSSTAGCGSCCPRDGPRRAGRRRRSGGTCGPLWQKLSFCRRSTVVLRRTGFAVNREPRLPQTMPHDADAGRCRAAVAGLRRGPAAAQGAARGVWHAAARAAGGTQRAAPRAGHRRRTDATHRRGRAKISTCRPRSTCARPTASRFSTECDPAYPRALREIHDPPGMLFVRGEILPQDALAMAIVGSRHATHYGLAQAERLAGSLARAGLTIVSGLARGIDAAAHRGALAAGGRTLAVLGSGVLNIYPPEHAELADEVAAHGAVVSEAPPRSPPLERRVSAAQSHHQRHVAGRDRRRSLDAVRRADHGPARHGAGPRGVCRAGPSRQPHVARLPPADSRRGEAGRNGRRRAGGARPAGRAARNAPTGEVIASSGRAAAERTGAAGAGRRSPASRSRSTPSWPPASCRRRRCWRRSACWKCGTWCAG